MLTSLLLAAETAKLGAAIGAGIAAVGAGLGIGRIGGQLWMLWLVSQKRSVTFVHQ